MDQQFKLAIALTSNKFKFAINGVSFSSFNYRNQNQLDILNGFKIVNALGLHLEVTSVDHMNIGSNECDSFETYSHPDVQLF